MKIFRRQNYLQIDFSDGSTYSTNECNDGVWNSLKENQDNEEVVYVYECQWSYL